MSKKFCLAILIAAAVSACGGKDTQVGSGSDSEAKADKSEAALSGKKMRAVVRDNSEGEKIHMMVPESDSVTESPTGGKCGVKSADGSMLSCQAGSMCVSPAEGQPGVCHTPPRPKRLETA